MPPLYSLSVSGVPADVECLIGDFISTFGDPLIRESDTMVPGMSICLWDAKEVDSRISQG
jgi:hypothetical protein